MLYIVDPDNKDEMAKAQEHSDRMVMRALEMGGTWVAWKGRTHTAKGWLRSLVRRTLRGEPTSVHRLGLVGQLSMPVIVSEKGLGTILTES